MSAVGRTTLRLLGIVVALIGCVTVHARDERAAESTDDRPAADVALYMPALAADGPLGFRAATVLNLQIWKTLRAAPTPNRAGLSFGSGVVVWGPEPLAALTHDAAANEARGVDADLALWGKAWRYGDGVVVQTYLTIIEGADDEAGPVWSADLDESGAPVSFAVGLPRLRYEFAPVVLDADVVDSLSSPAGLQMVASKGSTEVIGTVGDQFKAEQHDGAWTRLRSGDTVGWIYLPQLSDQPSEVVDFVGGVIRILRRDWRGATNLLGRVVDNPRVPHSIKIDALLMLALAAHHDGGDPLVPIRKAYALNPHWTETTRFECMALFQQLVQASGSSAAAGLRAQLAGILQQRRYLYSSDDDWFRRMSAVASGDALVGMDTERPRPVSPID